MNNILLFLDWDGAGIAGAQKSAKILKKYALNSYIIPPLNEYFFGSYQPDHFSCDDLKDFISLYM